MKVGKKVEMKEGEVKVRSEVRSIIIYNFTKVTKMLFTISLSEYNVIKNCCIFQHTYCIGHKRPRTANLL